MPLPVRLVVSPDDASMQAQIEVTANAPLVRLVDLMFSLSIKAGADVRLAGEGAVTRAELWMRLTDEQDRIRIAEALRRASERGSAEEVLNRLWAVLAMLAPGRDIRWDAAHERIVELREVGEPGGISLEEAAWHQSDASMGDVIPVPVRGYLHMLAWRWFSEAYPGLAES